MALYVDYTEHGTTYKKYLTWHVREPKEEFRDNIKTVNTIAASGDELDAIKALFKNNETGAYTIPMPNSYQVWWFGDTAKTILMAL